MNGRVTSLNLQIVISKPGTYESLRLGAEWTPNEGVDLQKEFLTVDKELRENAAAIMANRAISVAQKPNATNKTVEAANAEQPKPEEVEKTKEEVPKTAKTAKKAVESPKEQQTDNNTTQEEKAPQNEEKQKNSGEDARDVLHVGDPRVQQLVKRIEKASGNEKKMQALVDNIKKYYILDEEVQNVLNLSKSLN